MKPKPPPAPGYVRSDEVLLLQEFRRRFRLGSRGWAQFRDEFQLPTVQVGRQLFVRGRDVLTVFDRLGEAEKAKVRNAELCDPTDGATTGANNSGGAD